MEISRFVKVKIMSRKDCSIFSIKIKVLYEWNALYKENWIFANIQNTHTRRFWLSQLLFKLFNNSQLL